MQITSQYIQDKLTENLKFTDLKIQVIAKDDAFSYIQLNLECQELKQMSMVKSHQMILNVFKNELESNIIHAITINIK